MSDRNAQRLSLEEEQRIDAVCAEFEAAVQRGENPDLEVLIEAVDLPLRPRLREELGSLQRELAHGSGVASPASLPGNRLGGYRILEKIGEGGMGMVFEAVQEATRRRVAVKVVRSDLRSEQVRRRFEREARLLGHLHHPGIAQIFDAGVDEKVDPSRPTPYLVMELLRGLPLIEHAEEYGLGPRERLEIVRRVCGAVQHAHDQGIVHRDLKPANILVVDAGSSEGSRTDSVHAVAGSPKVLDFGIARVLEGGLGMSVETQTGQIVGTMAYMSPEQLDGASGQVDGRADVYALGVILYQLLAGRLPHDITGLNVPSAIDLLRRAEPRRLGHVDGRLRGDIEIIVGKALEKRVEHRYPTAAALAADLQRHLDDVPIEARPPDAIDRLRKFARRNRGLFNGIVTAVAALLVSLVLVSIFAWRQVSLREAADVAREEADRRERVATATSAFLEDMLRQADLTRGGTTRQTTLYEVLESASEGVDRAFPEDPLSEAAVRAALGASFLSQGAHAEAEPHLRVALATWRQRAPNDVAKIAELESSLGQAREAAGDYDGAEERYRTALRLRRDLPPGRDARLGSSLGNLGALLELRDRLDEALVLHRECLDWTRRYHGERSKQFAIALNNSAATHERLGDLEQARRDYEACLDVRRELLEAPHPYLANVLNNLGLLAMRQSRLEDAEGLLREALEMRGELYDDEHPLLAASYGALAVLLVKRGKPADAVAMQERAIESQRTRLGADHVDTLTSQVNLASMLGSHGDLEAMRDLAESALEGLREQVGPDHQKALWALGMLAKAEAGLGNLQRAKELRIEELSALRARGRETRQFGGVLLAYGQVLKRLGDGEDALATFREARAVFGRIGGEASYDALRAGYFVVGQLAFLGRYEDSVRLAEEILPQLEASGEEAMQLREELSGLRDAIRERLRDK